MKEIVNTKLWNDIDKDLAYKILQLRSEVFVSEQKCYAIDLDGVDINHDTQHWFIGDLSNIKTYCRFFPEIEQANTMRIGRVCTKKEYRGLGLAHKMIKTILDGTDVDVHISAQANLEKWYQKYGFKRIGKEFMECDIAHIPMVRTFQ